jgi:hypothetical protein
LPLSLVWLGAVSALVWALFGYAGATREYRAADRAAAGDGRPGVFRAQSSQCGRGGCFWYGTFHADRSEHNLDRWVRLRGLDHDTIVQGQVLPAIDVGERELVYATAASPTPVRAAAGPLAFGSLFGALGAVAVLILARRTPWSTVLRRPYGRDVVAACWMRVHDIFTGDRWAAGTWGPSQVRVQMIRSPARTVAWGIAFPFLALVSLGLLAMALDELPRTVEFENRLMLLWFALASVFALGLVVQIGRMLVLRPRVRVTGEEIIIWDSVLLWKAVRIRREEIAAVHHGADPYLMPGGYAEFTPFRERLNLHLLLRAERRLAGRHLRWGNWIWLVKDRELADRPRLPRREETYRRLALRVRQPEQATEQLRRWLAHDTAHPTARQPGFEPADHFMHGRCLTHHGTGDRTITINGTLPQPVLAQISNEGPSILRTTLHQTVHGRGRPLASVRAGEASARVVLDDQAHTAQRRHLRLRAAGSWTVTLSGPQAAREFDRAIHGEGADVLAYTGPAGIAILTGGGGIAKVLLRRPDLALREGPLHLAQAGRHRALGDLGASLRTAFAVPTGAVLQISGEGDWNIEVLPLRRVPGVPDLLEGPGVKHLRAFKDSVRGSHTQVLLYTGPHTNLTGSYKGKGGIALHRLDDGLAPVATHLIARGHHDEHIEVSPWTLLQISGDGLGRWHLRTSSR